MAGRKPSTPELLGLARTLAEQGADAPVPQADFTFRDPAADVPNLMPGGDPPDTIKAFVKQIFPYLNQAIPMVKGLAGPALAAARRMGDKTGSLGPVSSATLLGSGIERAAAPLINALEAQRKPQFDSEDAAALGRQHDNIAPLYDAMAPGMGLPPRPGIAELLGSMQRKRQ